MTMTTARVRRTCAVPSGRGNARGSGDRRAGRAAARGDTRRGGASTPVDGASVHYGEGDRFHTDGVQRDIVNETNVCGRRGRRRAAGEALLSAAVAALVATQAQPRPAVAEDSPPPVSLCDDACASKIAGAPEVTTESGLRYKDIVVGKGPSPITGFQVVVNYTGYVAATMQQFVTTLGKKPADVRAGTGGLIAGLEEGEELKQDKHMADRRAEERTYRVKNCEVILRTKSLLKFSVPI